MIFVIGAIASGKKDYVRSLGYSPEAMSDALDDSHPVLIDLEKLVDADPDNCMQLLPDLLKKEVVVCCEVGSGVIPAVRRDRESREATGRLCIALAKKAERVIRLVAGIPVVIKS